MDQENIEIKKVNFENKLVRLSGLVALLVLLVFIVYSFIPYNFRFFLDRYPVMPLAFALSLVFGVIWLVKSKDKNKSLIGWSLVRIVIYSIVLTVISLLEGSAGAREMDMLLLCILVFADLLISITLFIIRKIIDRK